MESRLDSWKASLLSKGGRLILIKAVMAVISNYLLSLFTILVSVANHMERMIRDFLWHDGSNHHKYHIVDWNMVCRPMNSGSLDIRKIRVHNIVLMGKWIRRFGRERDSLWRRGVVVAQFGVQSVWDPKEVLGRHGCGIWKSIMKVKETF